MKKLIRIACDYVSFPLICSHSIHSYSFRSFEDIQCVCTDLFSTVPNKYAFHCYEMSSNELSPVVIKRYE